MRHITHAGIALIRRFEGFSATPYRCPAGYLTIGYGHVIPPGAPVPDSLTQQEAADLLAEDVMTAERAVLRLVHAPLTDGQFDALVSFTFNLGAGALQRSTLRRRVNREEYSEASGEFLRWVFAGGRRISGLKRRREAERERFLGAEI